MDAPRLQPHRLPRHRYVGQVSVTVTACIEDRRRAFAEPTITRQFIDILASCAGANDCVVPVYCFMPDHLHLILRGEAPVSDTYRAMILFKQRSGFWLSRNHPQVRWQKDFYDHIIRNNEDVRSQIRYIAENPVRRGLVEHWHEYPHTGAIGIDLGEVLWGASRSSRS